MSRASTAASGLEGVIAAETALSEVDGERGRLIIRGHDVEELASRVTFEGACALLWSSPAAEQDAQQIRAGLGRARVAAYRMLRERDLPVELADPMDALRAATAQLPSGEAEDPTTRHALTGALPVFAAAWHARRCGRALPEPDPELSHAADTLRMLHAEEPSAERVSALDAYLVTVIDHGMNASTFTARVIASTRSDAVSSVVGALGALKGPAHGGAPGPVLDMLDAIGSPEHARAWLERELAAGRRIMGMGHRVYRERDPRAAVLESRIERLERAGIAPERLALARAVERAALQVLETRSPGRKLRANVEFYTAVLLAALGLPRSLFTPTFAVSRVAGWLAHVVEQNASGRLIRPLSAYVGPRPAELCGAAL